MPLFISIVDTVPNKLTLSHNISNHASPFPKEIVFK